MLFQWTALGAGQFRLLKNRRPLPDGQLSYELHTANIKAAPTFAVVTYLRSSTSSDQPVLVNGRTITMNRQGHSALKQIADLGEYDYLWIDCLSIHESDAEEKTRQEKAMTKIYAAADCIYVCQDADALEDSALPKSLPALDTKTRVVPLRSSL